MAPKSPSLPHEQCVAAGSSSGCRYFQLQLWRRIWILLTDRVCQHGHRNRNGCRERSQQAQKVGFLRSSKRRGSRIPIDVDGFDKGPMEAATRRPHRPSEAPRHCRRIGRRWAHTVYLHPGIRSHVSSLNWPRCPTFSRQDVIHVSSTYFDNTGHSLEPPAPAFIPIRHGHSEEAQCHHAPRDDSHEGQDIEFWIEPHEHETNQG